MKEYRELANAVIVQAVREFKAAYRRLKRFPNDKKAGNIVREITEFFCSEQFCLLTDLDGPELMKKIKRMIDKENII